MILNHIWGLYAHPREEWHSIDREREGLSYSLIHIMLVALIPPICSYYAAVHLGWGIGVSEPIFMSNTSALILGIAMYVTIIVSAVALAYLTQWMAQTFGSKPDIAHCLELAAYASTPLLMVGFAALYPQIWFIMLVGLAGLSYSIYLLYSGIPILMHIPQERGFIYASSVVTCSLVTLVFIMSCAVMVWSLFRNQLM